MKQKEKVKISKRQLAKFVKQNKATKWIAHYFKVSETTIKRKIREYGLKGIRKRGRKRFAVEIPIVEKPRIWIPTKEYIDELTKIYHFQNIQYPPTKYINAQTGICSDAQHNPKGLFTTCTVYYIALESKLFFLYTVQYRYSEKGVSFDEIYNYFKTNAFDMLSLSLENTGIEVIDIIAFHFFLNRENLKFSRDMQVDKHVVLPIYLRDGIKPLKQGYPRKVKLLVFDVETCDGEPYLLTFYDGKHVSFLKVDKKTVLNEFINYLLEHCTNNQFSYILFSHNLPFDLTAIFTKYEMKIFRYRTATYIHFTDKTKKEPLAIIKLFTHKVWFAQIKLKNKISIKVVDSNAFIKGSLYELSRILKFKYKKYERPYFVEQGKKPQNREEWNQLYIYCYHEIKAQYELAEYILNMHKEYDTTFTVSIAQLSSKIFRKHFLKEPIPQIPEHIKKLAELTIHGGRASVFVETPCLIPNVKMYDYNSFYPFSMANLPNITKGDWKEVYDFDYEHEGFYWISGYVKPCEYPIIIKSVERMEFANGEYVSNIPIASYELREALRNNEIQLTKIHGYVWIPHPEAKNPFREYVMHFYNLKESYKKDSPLYIQAKLLLNSLYGKTYQTLIHPKSENKEDFRIIPETKKIIKIETLYKAGGLYLPHIGSWITSQCRAILHKDLHFYDGLDCATDSFKTTKTIQTNETLGSLKKENEGMLLLLRPKLYVMFSHERQNEIIEYGNLTEYLKKELNSMEIGKDIVKYALHGFQGNIHTLLNLIANNKQHYQTKHMIKIREAIKQNKQPRTTETQTRQLKIPIQTIQQKTQIPLTLLNIILTSIPTFL